MPATLDSLADCEVNYVEMDGWKEDISKISKFGDLPKAAQDYLKFIEKETKMRISWVGTGPAREAMFKTW